MAKYTMEAIIKAVDRISGPLRRIQVNLRTTGRHFTALSTSMKAVTPQLAAVVTGYLGISKAVRGLKSAAEAGDIIAKTADRVGFGIENFQKFSHVADLSGISSEEFTKAL